MIYGHTSNTSARIERWVLCLQGYDYTVIYHPDKSNIADCLSRLNRQSNKDQSSESVDVRFIAKDSEPVAMNIKEIETESSKDEELSCVRYYVQHGNCSNCKLRAYAAVKHELCSVGQIIMCGNRIIIPKKLRGDVLKLAYEGHQGIAKTKLNKSMVAENG